VGEGCSRGEVQWRDSYWEGQSSGTAAPEAPAGGSDQPERGYNKADVGGVPAAPCVKLTSLSALNVPPQGSLRGAAVAGRFSPAAPQALAGGFAQPGVSEWPDELLRVASITASAGIVTSVLFTCQTRPAPVGSDEQNQ
jgi:hypothetical protein